ncbi:MAG: YdeI/OmpD-associated family protein [Bdellovibrionales bacterium]|nr:YdeI/OmpD-associated family protein [Bdellovibrionales bacterium]
MKSKIDEYISNLKNWKNETIKMREIILSCNLKEEIKWSKPCYTLDKKNIVVIQGFKSYFAVLFFKGVLMKDPKKILEKTGENTRVGRQLKFLNLKEIEKMEKTIKTYIAEAIRVEKSGEKVKVSNDKLILVEELENRLKKNKSLKAAFERLTPGRQRAYNLYISSAKQPKTRESRIDKFVPKIMKGKGIHD